MELAAALADLDKIPELMLSLEQQSSVCEPINEEVKAEIEKFTSLTKGWEEAARVGIETLCADIERDIDANILRSIYEVPKQFGFLSTFEKNYSKLCDGEVGDLFESAIEERDTVAAEFCLLSERLEPNQPLFYTLMAPIEAATVACDTKMVSLLLKDPRVVTLNDAFASSISDPETLKLFLEDGRCDPTSSETYALFIQIIRNGNIQSLELFLQDKRINLSSPIRLGTYYESPALGMYALANAIELGHVTIVKRLLCDKCVDPSKRLDGSTTFIETPLSMACRKGFIDIVNLLLEDKRVDPSHFDNISIHSATLYNKLDVVKRLLRESRVISHSSSGLAKGRFVEAQQYVISSYSV